MLKFDNVSFQYDVEDFSIIDHLSFDVQDGEFVSVIGASGCGKSTIFRLVNKLLLPASGEILVDGCNVHMWKLQELRRGNRRAVEELGIEDCTQCTCCSYICPSRQSVAGEILLYRQKMKGGEEP